MASNAPPGADYDSRAPWYSDPGEPDEREYDKYDNLTSNDDFDDKNNHEDVSDNYYQ